MAGETFKALRVPIALLHEKVYETSHRLPKLVRLKPKKDDQLEHIKAQFGPGPLRVISPSAPVGVQLTPFEKNPLLKRFYWLTQSQNILMCRACGKAAFTDADQASHTLKCWPTINAVLMRLKAKNKCVICEQPLDHSTLPNAFHGLPVCTNAACKTTWERVIPPAYKLEQALMTIDNEAARGNHGNFD